MSVAFRRESDEEHLEPKFELPIPPGPNLVTERGLALVGLDSTRVPGWSQYLVGRLGSVGDAVLRVKARELAGLFAERVRAAGYRVREGFGMTEFGPNCFAITDEAALAKLLAGKAPENVGHQCGSGITACANLFAMEHAGLTGSKLYAGSWSEWIADPKRPQERG